MKELKYTQVKANGGTQMRDGVNTDTVAEYADAMRHNKSYQPFPPLIVYFDGSEYWLADGFHRLAAAFHAFGSGCSIPADVRAGTQRDAILHAAGANAEHGLRRTNADKRRAVEALLRDGEWVKWSDREIARRCGVGNQMVSHLRSSICVNHTDTERTVVRNDKTYTMNTQRIGNTIWHGLIPPPAAPPPRREYESVIPLITPAIIEPEPRRAATPAIIAEPDPEPEAEKEPKDNDEYYTPSYILEPARQVLGSIDLDPASCADANEIVGATKFYDKAINGLIFPWFGQIWLNPPYSDPLPWIERLFQQYAAGKTTGAMVLVNTTNSPRWARLLWQSEHRVCLLGKRIKFWRADQPEGKGFDRDQMIWYLGEDPQLFADVFSELGSIR